MVQKTLSKSVIKRLMKKYRRPLGTRVGDSKQIMQRLAKGTSIPTFMGKGGHVRRKKKKK